MYKTIDLCAGIGGIRKGFEMTGKFKNVLSAEIDLSACKTYELLFGENPFNDLTSDDFKRKVIETTYDVLLAGFPCQTFSRAGLEKGFDDSEKGVIFWHIAEIIEKTHPKAFFLENVDNLVKHDNGRTFRIIIETLEKKLNYKIIGAKRDENGEISYDWRDYVRNSKHFGVPQNRPRTYIMGFDRNLIKNESALCDMVLPTHNDIKIYEDLCDVLEMNAPEKYYMSAGYWETLKRHKARQKKNGNGYGYVIVNRDGIEHPIANTLLATGGSGKERNLIVDYRDGISGKEIKGKHSPLNSEGIRVMTPREWGKLQGFINYAFVENGQDRFSFPEGTKDGKMYKQFGNSVTIPVIKSMAEFMLGCFEYLKI